MRLRNIKGSIEYVNNHPLVNQHPKKYIGRWKEFFGNDKPIHIEIGMGKGDFMIGKAQAHPNINFIGIEKYSGVLLRAVKKVESLEKTLPNLSLLRLDAIDLLDVFDQQEIEKIYLNFSDPWLKERKAKHRLTHRGFLNRYKQILVKDGLLQFKSDNDDLYAFSLEEIEQSNFEIIEATTNLHESEFVEGNIMTEYESKFVANGKNINYVVIKNRVI